jgi:hypothetical protein
VKGPPSDILNLNRGRTNLATQENSMRVNGDQIELNDEEASGGVKQHGVRYVLGFSLLLVIGLLSLVWILGSVFK